jgi:acyl carrier protein
MQRAEVVKEIYRALERANALRPTDAQLPCVEETILYGAGAGLDSLGLVSLILDVEEAVNEKTAGGLVLADAKAMSQRHNPFRDVRSLADHVMGRLSEVNA